MSKPPAWVKVSERLPTEEDADENGFVWVCKEGACEAWTEDWENGLEWLHESCWDYWQPKPRQQPPAPPRAALQDDMEEPQ